MKPYVSVIVPIYNVEAYLEACLDSLKNQTLKNIEFILVNDGSPDHSQDIIDRYVENDPKRFLAFTKENGGLADARNFGLKQAKGDFIGFIDSDDFIEPTMYERLWEMAVKLKSDLVVCDLEYDFEDKSRNFCMRGYLPKLNKPLEKAIFLSPLFAWNKLYRKEVLIDSNLRFPTGQWYEDIPVTVPFFSVAKNIQYLPETFIHYRQRSNSIMGSTTHPKMMDIFTSLEKVLTYYTDRSLLDDYHDELEYLYVEHLLLYGSFRFLRSDDHKSLMTHAFNSLSTTFPQWRKNPYLKTLKLRYRIYLGVLNPFSYPLFRGLMLRKGNHV